MEEKQEFSILDPKGSKTVAFAIESDYIDNEPVKQPVNNNITTRVNIIYKYFFVFILHL